MPHAEVAIRPCVRGWLLGLAILLLYAAQIAAFQPGVITPDTVFQWSQALSGQYDDWHPPVTAWLWRQLLPFGHGTMPVLLLQCALYWLGVGLCADALRRRGANWGMAAVMLVAAAPIPFGQMGAILKDPLLAACCLAAAGLLLLSLDRPAPVRRALAVALLVLASATRVNAIFATAPLLVALMPLRSKGGLWRTLAALMVAATFLFLTTALINRLALQPHRAQPIFSLVNYDLAGIVADGGHDAYPNLSDDIARPITAHCYAPTLYNPHDLPECNRVEDALFAFASARHVSPVRIWFDAIARSPLAWLRHRLAHLNWNWRLFVPSVPNDAVYVMSEPNAFGLRFVEGGGARLIARAATWLAWSPLGRPATWIAVAAGLFAIGSRLPSARFVLATSASALGYGGAYAIVSVAPDMRYNLWTMLAAAMALIVAATDFARTPQYRTATGRLCMAAAPAVLAIAVELAGLL